jgi:hAT family C-terminal dimerisation region
MPTRHYVNPNQPPNKFTEWKHTQRASGTSAVVTNEYTRYCDSPPVPNVHDARQWWQEDTQQRNFPNLSQMALDILSIPAMSAEPERVFSSIGYTGTKPRGKLFTTTLEALEQIKSWCRLRAFDLETSE